MLLSPPCRPHYNVRYQSCRPLRTLYIIMSAPASRPIPHIIIPLVITVIVTVLATAHIMMSLHLSVPYPLHYDVASRSLFGHRPPHYDVPKAVNTVISVIALAVCHCTHYNAVLLPSPLLTTSHYNVSRCPLNDSLCSHYNLKPPISLSAPITPDPSAHIIISFRLVLSPSMQHYNVAKRRHHDYRPHYDLSTPTAVSIIVTLVASQYRPHYDVVLQPYSSLIAPHYDVGRGLPHDSLYSHYNSRSLASLSTFISLDPSARIMMSIHPAHSSSTHCNVARPPYHRHLWPPHYDLSTPERTSIVIAFTCSRYTHYDVFPSSRHPLFAVLYYDVPTVYFDGPRRLHHNLVSPASLHILITLDLVVDMKIFVYFLLCSLCYIVMDFRVSMITVVTFILRPKLCTYPVSWFFEYTSVCHNNYKPKVFHNIPKKGLDIQPTVHEIQLKGFKYKSIVGSTCQWERERKDHTGRWNSIGQGYIFLPTLLFRT